MLNMVVVMWQHWCIEMAVVVLMEEVVMMKSVLG